MIISDNCIVYDSSDYPYSEFKDKTILHAGKVYACISGFNPPALLTNQRNIFFVGRRYEAELLSFCLRNHIEKIQMQDNWFLILEEFLDTELGTNEKEKTYELLERVGISRRLCTLTRKDITPMMIEYNFKSCLWEWCYLGMYDLLMAAQGKLSKGNTGLGNQQMEELYRFAVKIALMQFSDTR